MFAKPRQAPLTYLLLAIIAVVFAWEKKLGADQNGEMLIRMGAIIPGLFQSHDYRRLLTAMFLHADVVHWAANSFSLLQLGGLYEALFGTKRFGFIYFVTGLFASVVSAAYQHVSVGASGAIFGILGAFIFSVRRSPRYRNERWTRSLIRQLVFWIGVNLVISFAVPYIDVSAHLAGLASGLLLGFLPHRVPPPPPADVVIDVPPTD